MNASVQAAPEKVYEGVQIDSFLLSDHDSVEAGQPIENNSVEETVVESVNEADPTGKVNDENPVGNI